MAPNSTGNSITLVTGRDRDCCHQSADRRLWNLRTIRKFSSFHQWVFITRPHLIRCGWYSSA